MFHSATVTSETVSRFIHLQFDNLSLIKRKKSTLLCLQSVPEMMSECMVSVPVACVGQQVPRKVSAGGSASRLAAPPRGETVRNFFRMDSRQCRLR